MSPNTLTEVHVMNKDGTLVKTKFLARPADVGSSKRHPVVDSSKHHHQDKHYEAFKASVSSRRHYVLIHQFML